MSPAALQCCLQVVGSEEMFSEWKGEMEMMAG